MRVCDPLTYAPVEPDPARLNLLLDQALQSLRVVYQPILTPGGDVYGVEALARCAPGLFPGPAELFAGAIQADRAFELGQAVRDIVARDIVHMEPELRVFVNVHPAELANPALRLGQEALAAHASRVVLEITEQMPLPPGMELIGRQLRRVGYRVALDDLGDGEDSLVRLSRTAPDLAKLDRSVVHGIHRSAWRRAFVDAILQLCASRGIPVVAEGVERAEDLRYLVGAGVTLLQGFLLGRASPPPPGPREEGDPV